MSSTTKRKFVTKEIINEYVLPDASKELVRVTAGRATIFTALWMLPERSFWLPCLASFVRVSTSSEEDYVLIEKIPEGGKVKAEIVHIPLKDQIKYIRDQGLWPKAFEEEEEKISPEEEEENSDEEDDDDLFKNTNRRVIEYSSSSESSD
ncbi:putative RNA-binding protein EIF1AD [Caligus rogercresseyi]|uniref:Putative RNA-binding protein EIF1AD n=1 Tax=Caligus rogercresseyi TaxID=217165 RepID=A0A7T8GVX5_CALRO|nr:putative RNA-binding protein EIF1AD [Caligus rogercresseyi]